MSQFPHNLSVLRRRAGYTQEALAQELEVSRQAVGKWESGQTFPEAATLLALADLLGCTLDQLMREELKDLPAAPEEAPEPETPEAEILEAGISEPESGPALLLQEYSAHMDLFSLQMAGGVGLTLGGVAALLTGCALLGGALAVFPLFICLAGAVYLFITGGIAHSDFRKNFPRPVPAYPTGELSEFRRLFRTGVGVAVAGILGDVALLVVLCILSAPSVTFVLLSVSLFMALMGLCVGLLVYLGLQRAKFSGKG